MNPCLSESWAQIIYKLGDLKLGKRGRFERRVVQWKTEKGEEEKREHLKKHGAEYCMKQEFRHLGVK